MPKPKTRKLVIKVTPQTAWHIEKLSETAGYSTGKVVDKLVRTHMANMRASTEKRDKA